MTKSTVTNVRIVEVGPRDGLQNIATAIPTAIKISLIQKLCETGLRTVEITSAVSPKAVPQLADNQEILTHHAVKDLIRQDEVRLPVLVPNKKGLELAMRHGVKEVAVFVSATEGFSRANTKCSVKEGLARAKEVVEIALSQGLHARGYVSCIFHDPYDGPTPVIAVLRSVRELLAMGCYEVSLGDTVGVGAAADVQRLLNYLFDNGISSDKLAGHFHDTYGQAVSNVWTAFKLGIRTFDSSVAGLGGCPFAPGAKGNVASEDLVYLFERAGVQTGVDLLKLAQTGSWISAQLRHRNESRVGAALISKLGLNYSTTTPSPASKDAIAWTLLPDQIDDLRILRAGPNLKIVIDRPEKANSLNIPTITNLTELFVRLSRDCTISRIFLTATGKFFCTGMDLGKTSPVAHSATASTEQFERLTRLFEAIDTAPQITVAAINGPAFGGGVGLAFACDIRIGVKDTTFTLSEVKLGLCAATISKYVIREWGPALTREAMLTARPVALSQLYSLGIVSRMVDSVEMLDYAGEQLLLSLKHSAPRASTLSKELVRGSQRETDQPERIREAFEEMMAPGGESSFGLREYQAGRRGVDWDDYITSKGGAKL